MCDMRKPPKSYVDLKTGFEFPVQFHGHYGPSFPDKTEKLEVGLYTAGASGMGYAHYDGISFDWLNYDECHGLRFMFDPFDINDCYPVLNDVGNL